MKEISRIYKYKYDVYYENGEEIDKYVRIARLNWKFTSQDIEWINKEIGPHDFSLLGTNTRKLHFMSV